MRHFTDSKTKNKPSLNDALAGIKRPRRGEQFTPAALSKLDENLRQNGPIQTTGPAPQVPARAVRGCDGVWDLIIDTCPYCHCRHFHGGGGADQPSSYGHRNSHCGPWFDNPGYILEGEA